MKGENAYPILYFCILAFPLRVLAFVYDAKANEIGRINMLCCRNCKS
jgi:hypothetical protein